MSGFQRTRLKWKGPSKIVKKEGKKLDVDEQIAYALCALNMTSIKSHHLQNEVTQWICNNYGFVTPESVQRIFRRMVNSEDHIIRKQREGRFMRYEIDKLFDLDFRLNQGKLF